MQQYNQNLINQINERSVSNLTTDITFRVSFVEETEVGAIFENSNSQIKIGKVILPNEKLRTRGSRVELRNDDGIVFRLRENSTFEIADTEIGLKPIVSGKLYKYRVNYRITSGPCWKAPMSCWNGCNSTMVYEINSSKKDTYYNLGDVSTIFEFDENGKKFSIVTLEEGERCSFIVNKQKPMRERYEVIDKKIISDSDYDRLIKEYINPKIWR